MNDTDQLDVVRRIGRGQGSAYSVNGREIRARDVQTLFADAATGSRSTALVSQGRIGALISAKPVDRRSVIDEAAGIRDVLLAAQPTKKFVTVEQVAALTAFRCSPDAASITGAVLPIDGGWTAQ